MDYKILAEPPKTTEIFTKLTKNKLRIITDVLVVFFHALSTLLVFTLDQSFLDTIQGKLILSLEIVTISFHSFYVLLYVYSNTVLKIDEDHILFQERFNHWKWLVSLSI